jgi:hypothetical protein
MKFKPTIKTGLIILYVFIAGCKQTPYNGALTGNKLIPFTVVYTEGDDGLQTYTLKVSGHSNNFFAEEIKTDNYSVPRTFDTSKILILSEAQILKARQFLIQAAALPQHCDQTTSVTQKLNIFFSNGEIKIEGNCAWNDAYYFELRKYLFGKE